MDQPIVEERLASADEELPDDLRDLIGDLAKSIYEGKSISYDRDLLQATARPLINGIEKGFGKSLTDVDWDSPDRKALENLTQNAFKFSASKDWHILRDMTDAMRDGDRVRSFEEFKAEVDKINVKYNLNWLRTEYNQAIAASQATARWQEFQQNADSMPFLQYQAVMDANTRPDHARLNGVVKRIESPFWNTHFPPLGWGCRCEVIQLPGRNHQETPDGSFQSPEVHPQFRENFGKEQKLFSDKHPYYQGTPKEVKVMAEKYCKRYSENLKQYEELKDDPNYKEVEFNPENGGMKATHKDHNFDKSTGKYEIEVQNAGYRNGNSVVFTSEKGKPDGTPYTEGLWDGYTFEIGTSCGTGKGNIKGILKHCKAKGAQVAVINFKDKSLFSMNRLIDGIKAFEGQTKYRFKHIIYIVDGEVYYYQ